MTKVFAVLVLEKYLMCGGKTKQTNFSVNVTTFVASDMVEIL